MEAEKLTASKFADTIGVKRSNISHLLNGRNQPSYAFIQKVLEVFTNVNSRWLITGQGKMYEKPIVAEVPKKQPDDLFSETKTDNLHKTIENENVEKEEDTVNNDLTAPTKPDKPGPPEKLATNNEIEKEENEAEKDEDIKAMNREAVGESKKKSIAKVLIFYENDTFKEYNPAE
ncbi:MAG: helix-turn-helix domain-containing protein [Prolixibacteraceae bacterium]|nr:helix-turn-helix domain-containing protein [Prolixibacteraceae bacterium]